jgi:hypothetical protein
MDAIEQEAFGQMLDSIFLVRCVARGRRRQGQE